jgi:hypothetical protein
MSTNFPMALIHATSSTHSILFNLQRRKIWTLAKVEQMLPCARRLSWKVTLHWNTRTTLKVVIITFYGLLNLTYRKSFVANSVSEETASSKFRISWRKAKNQSTLNITATISSETLVTIHLSIRRHPRKMVSSTAPVWEPRVSHTFTSWKCVTERRNIYTTSPSITTTAYFSVRRKR